MSVERAAGREAFHTRIRSPLKRRAVTAMQQAPCWCPHHGRRITTDNEHFEALTCAVFCARFNPEVVKRRWPAIREGFADFELNTVASWNEMEVARILSVPGMIRNRKKIVATLRNAVELAKIADRYGSVEEYLRLVSRSTEELSAALDSWTHYIGTPSIRCYLKCTGAARYDGE